MGIIMINKKTICIILFLLFSNFQLFSQEKAKYIVLGVHTGKYTYGLRNFEALLEDFNFSNTGLYNKLIEPFNYKNQFKGFNIGYGYIKETDNDNLMYFLEWTWTHHRNIYSAAYEFWSANIDNNSQNDMLVDYKERLNYFSFSTGLMFFKYVYGGIGLDWGKLSILRREYERKDSPPKFERFWHADDIGSPGGRYLAGTVFVGLFPYYKHAGINIRAYYQLQLLRSSMMQGTVTEYYVNMSNIGVKVSLNIGGFKNIE